LYNTYIAYVGNQEGFAYNISNHIIPCVPLPSQAFPPKSRVSPTDMKKSGVEE